jgi:hypothetical protein
MDAELKAKWVKALRSGEYQQGTSALRRVDEFCCLGVLADMIGANWVRRKDGLPSQIPFLGEKQIGSATHLNNDILPDDIQGDLVCQNDSGKTFPEIADYIEREL